MKKEPAFPVLHNGSTLPGGSGLTMRNYFAAKAMQAMLCRHDDITINCPDNVLAKAAYNTADAMLKARGEE